MTGALVVASGIDWNMLLDSLIVALPACVGAVIGYRNRQSLKTPSGDPIGHVVERTHDLSAADLAHTTEIHRIVKRTPPEGLPIVPPDGR